MPQMDLSMNHQCVIDLSHDWPSQSIEIKTIQSNSAHQLPRTDKSNKADMTIFEFIWLNAELSVLDN